MQVSGGGGLLSQSDALAWIRITEKQGKLLSVLEAWIGGPLIYCGEGGTPIGQSLSTHLPLFAQNFGRKLPQLQRYHGPSRLLPLSSRSNLSGRRNGRCLLLTRRSLFNGCDEQGMGEPPYLSSSTSATLSGRRMKANTMASSISRACVPLPSVLRIAIRYTHLQTRPWSNDVTLPT
jgi:hypothetical protein